MIRRELFGEFLQRNIQITFVGIREAGQPTDGRAKNFVAFFLFGGGGSWPQNLEWQKNSERLLISVHRREDYSLAEAVA